MVRRASSRFAFVAITALILSLLGMAPASAEPSSEQQGTRGANTFQNYHNASGMGQKVPAGAWVDVSCKVYDPYIGTANPDGYWYRIASAPWNNQYYAIANTFMNGDPQGGPYTHNTDFNVPDCGSAPAPVPVAAPTPIVTLSQGPAARSGYRYGITLSHFPANTAVSVNCYDSASPRGFYPFSITTDGAGNASTAAYCYSSDGPDHWIVANGVESNHVSWSGVSQAPPDNPQPPPVVNPPATPRVALTQGPRASAGYRYAITLDGFAANGSVAVKCFDTATPGGFYPFNLRTDGAGHAATAAYCYSDDGPNHWVVANGVESNHIAWGGSGNGTNSRPGGGSAAGGGASNSGSHPVMPPVTSPTAGPRAISDPCIARYWGGGKQVDHSIFGGTETNYDRTSSLYQQCEGFGAPDNLQYTPEMQCALIAAAATFGGPVVNVGVSRGCDAGGVVDAFKSHEWLGPAKGQGCAFFSDIFAGSVGVFVAGAASETGPGAVAIGVNTYKALAASLKVACSGLLDGGAATFGHNLEARHEEHVAVDIVRSGKCLRERKVFGQISWSAANC